MFYVPLRRQIHLFESFDVCDEFVAVNASFMNWTATYSLLCVFHVCLLLILDGPNVTLTMTCQPRLRIRCSQTVKPLTQIIQNERYTRIMTQCRSELWMRQEQHHAGHLKKEEKACLQKRDCFVFSTRFGWGRITIHATCVYLLNPGTLTHTRPHVRFAIASS